MSCTSKFTPQFGYWMVAFLRRSIPDGWLHSPLICTFATEKSHCLMVICLPECPPLRVWVSNLYIFIHYSIMIMYLHIYIYLMYTYIVAGLSLPTTNSVHRDDPSSRITSRRPPRRRVAARRVAAVQMGKYQTRCMENIPRLHQSGKCFPWKLYENPHGEFTQQWCGKLMQFRMRNAWLLWVYQPSFCDEAPRG